MKKLILLAAAATFTLHGLAQDKYVTSALTDLKENNLDDAKSDIDKAIANPETKEKPKALFAKAQIYSMMQLQEKYRASLPYRDAAQALFKLVEVKPDYEKSTVDQLLIVCAFNYYNDGVRAFNAKKYMECVDLMKNVVKIYDMKANRRFENVNAETVKKADTVAAEAYQTIANSYYYTEKYKDAIPMLVKVKNNPITKTPTAYECLIDAYNKDGNSAEAYNTIQEGRKAFPEDMAIRHDEINYFILTGKQDELVKKLEDAGAAEPNNADIQFNIATTYLGMSNPKDGKKPANEAELTGKAESAFQRALKLSPDNASFNYNFGALYYNQATEVNNQMNAITGSSAADLKKYDELKAKRDALFEKSTPFFEKSYSVLSADATKLKNEDLQTYKSTLMALKEVYARQNKLDKSTEMRKKYEALK